MYFIKTYTNAFLNRLNNQTLFYICISFLFLIFIIFRLSIVSSYSSDIVIGEDNNVWNIQKMMSGTKLYTNPENYPFEIFQYTPLSQYFTYFTAKIFSLKVGNNVHELFVIGRIYSLLFNILTSFVIFKINDLIFKVSKNVNLVFSFISLIIITYIDYTLRADSLSNLFTMISIFFLFKSLELENFKNIIYTVIFSLLAIFSKQSAIQIIVYFVAIYFIFSFKSMLKFLIVFSLSVLLFSLFFFFLYGKLFFYSTIVGISNPTELKLGISLLFDYTKRFGVLLFISIILVFLKNKWTYNSDYLIILFFLFVASFIFSFGTSQKIGAGLNYYTFNIYVSVIMSAIFIDQLYRSNFFRYNYLFLTLMISVVSLHIFLERLYNRHLPQISSSHQKEYYIDVNFVHLVKNKIGIARKQDYLFTPNKNIKNLYFYNTVLPNTEYYGGGASKFNWSNFDKKKLKYIIINENDSDLLNSRTFQQFHIKLTDYNQILKYKGRKLLCLKTI
jgi:hypothetical protein